jgi:hypothetical protein
MTSNNPKEELDPSPILFDHPWRRWRVDVMEGHAERSLTILLAIVTVLLLQLYNCRLTTAALRTR